MLKTEHAITTLRMFCHWARASDQFRLRAQDGAHRSSSGWRDENQPFYVDRFPSTEDLP